MKTFLQKVSTTSYVCLRKTYIKGWEIAYNKQSKMKKTIINDDGSKEIQRYSILTLVYKARNWAIAYLNNYVDEAQELFHSQAIIRWSYSAQAEGYRESKQLISLFLNQ